MDEKIIGLVKKYWRKELSQTEFVGFIQNEIGESKQAVVDLIQQVILNKNSDDLEYALVILYAIEKENEMIDLIHQLLLKPWHRTYEELAHDLQRRKNPTSIPFLKLAIQQKYPYLASYETGTRQFINQCGHALKSIGTVEAINTIRALSQSDDPIVRDEMLYRLSRIEGRNDYVRSN